MRRLAALAVALLVGAAVPLGHTAPARADGLDGCTTDTGTVVAVDFGHWGGPVVRGCGVDSPTGYQLLIDADFTMAGTQHDGPAFICRIGNPAWAHGVQYPTPSTEPCALTPPASAYWSYWIAPKGQHTWSYSSLGAMSDRPGAGAVELWHFGATNIAGTCGSGVPPYGPDVLRPNGSGRAGGDGASCTSTKDRSEASSGRQTGTTSGSHHGSSGGGGATGGGRTGSGGGATAGSSAPRGGSSAAGTGRTAPSSRATTRAGSSASSAPSDPSSTESVAAGSGGPTIVDARPASADTERPATGSVAPVLLGVALAVLLAGGTGWTVWRRRRAADG